MIRKGDKLYSIIKFKCPYCHEGEFFQSKNPYNLKQMGEVRKACCTCGGKFSTEPGFYQGSYYVTYALGVAVFVTFWVATVVLWKDYDPVIFCAIFVGAFLMLTPLLYALSKIIWANFFFSYKKKDPK